MRNDDEVRSFQKALDDLHLIYQAAGNQIDFLGVGSFYDHKQEFSCKFVQGDGDLPSNLFIYLPRANIKGGNSNQALILEINTLLPGGSVVIGGELPCAIYRFDAIGAHAPSDWMSVITFSLRMATVATLIFEKATDGALNPGDAAFDMHHAYVGRFNIPPRPFLGALDPEK